MQTVIKWPEGMRVYKVRQIADLIAGVLGCRVVVRYAGGTLTMELEE